MGPPSPRNFAPVHNSFSSPFGESLIHFAATIHCNKSRATQVPERYVLPPSDRPNPALTLSDANLPIIDLSALHHPSLRSQLIDQIRSAMCNVVFTLSQQAESDNSFNSHNPCNLSLETKMQLLSDNVHAPVRYGTSLNHRVDKVHFWRDFIKHYSHPISEWIHLWHDEIEKGSQVMTVNCYPACPEPELALGMPPHSDYGSLTILLQSCPGLQVMDKKNNWFSVPETEGALIVQLGDQLEVMSNGKYKSVIHRVTVSSEKKRFSIAGLHSLARLFKIIHTRSLSLSLNLRRFEPPLILCFV